MSLGRDHYNQDEEEDEGPYFRSEEGQDCPKCRQEYNGSCLLNIPNCPFEEDDEDPFADEDEDGPDFEDVKNLDSLLEKDEEADKVTEEELDDIPMEDLIDDKPAADDTIH